MLSTSRFSCQGAERRFYNYIINLVLIDLIDTDHLGRLGVRINGLINSNTKLSRDADNDNCQDGLSHNQMQNCRLLIIMILALSTLIGSRYLYPLTH